VKLVVVAVLLICLLGLGAAAAKRYLNPTRVVSRAFQIIDGSERGTRRNERTVRKRLHDTAVKLKPFARELKVIFDEVSRNLSRKRQRSERCFGPLDHLPIPVERKTR
jgi:hypothetical protein